MHVGRGEKRAGTKRRGEDRSVFSSGYRGFLPLGRVVRIHDRATELPGRDPLVELKPEGVGGEDGPEAGRSLSHSRHALTTKLNGAHSEDARALCDLVAVIDSRSLDCHSMCTDRKWAATLSGEACPAKYQFTKSPSGLLHTMVPHVKIYHPYYQKACANQGKFHG